MFRSGVMSLFRFCVGVGMDNDLTFFINVKMAEIGEIKIQPEKQ